MSSDLQLRVRVLDIIRGTTVDGPGFRTSIYLAGCEHDCPGCHNPQSHDPMGGSPMTLDEVMTVVSEEDFDVTLTGGDPMLHPDHVIALTERIHAIGHTVWMYTGYTLEQITASERLSEVLKYVDGIVDGPFVERLKDPDLLFRGSSNQRILLRGKDF